jgi:hypothetical protein
MEKVARALFFNDGNVLSDKTTSVASQFRKYSGSDISRVSIIVDRRWTYGDFDDAALSVTSLKDQKQIFFLGHNGHVLTIGKGQKIVETIPCGEEYGTLNRIRAVAGGVYACGMMGQVYRRGPSGWEHMDNGILGIEELDLEDIDGSAPDDLYAVGLYGSICHFNGDSWRRLDSPTNRPLSNVRFSQAGEFYICGDNGSLFRGNSERWQKIDGEVTDSNFYGLALFKDKVYVSHAGGVMVHDGSALADINFGLNKNIGCHRLDAGEHELWSFGLDDILVYDGVSWSEVICPMNVPPPREGT